jgi:hypothetical protein
MVGLPFFWGGDCHRRLNNAGWKVVITWRVMGKGIHIHLKWGLTDVAQSSLIRYLSTTTASASRLSVRRRGGKGRRKVYIRNRRRMELSKTLLPKCFHRAMKPRQGRRRMLRYLILWIRSTLEDEKIQWSVDCEISTSPWAPKKMRDDRPARPYSRKPLARLKSRCTSLSIGDLECEVLNALMRSDANATQMVLVGYLWRKRFRVPPRHMRTRWMSCEVARNPRSHERCHI